MDETLFNDLTKSLQQAIDYATTGQGDVRVSHYEVDGLDVKAVRQKTGMTQPEFAATFCINTETLRAWEQGKRTPPAYAIAYLKTIATNPQAVTSALAH